MWNLNALFIALTECGARGVVANAWLEGTFPERVPNVSRDEVGMCRLFRQLSFPGGSPSYAAPQTPGSIQEGDEMGYSLSQVFGAVFDNPDLIAACEVGDVPPQGRGHDGLTHHGGQRETARPLRESILQILRLSALTLPRRGAGTGSAAPALSQLNCLESVEGRVTRRAGLSLAATRSR